MLLATQAEKKGLRLNSQIDDVPELLMGDPFRLHQVLFNLVGNAIKFTDQGSVSIELSTKEAKTDQQCVISLAVRDTGMGISQQDQNKIFERFHQVNQFSPNTRGAGLGLNITQSLVALMRGEIHLSSQLGEGSVFTVDLPFERVESSSSSPDYPLFGNVKSTSDVDNKAQIDVLLVEDNKTNQMIYEKFLNKLGCRVDIADTGVAALERFESSRYAVIFMDCNMPEMDGFAATRSIRKIEQEKRLPQTPIIALTAHVQDEVKQQCMRAGMNDFLSKPFLFDALVNKLDKVREGGY